MRKFVAFLAAAGMAAAPLAAYAQDASALSLTRTSAPLLPGFSFLQDESATDEGGGGSTAVILGVVLIVLLGAAAISGDSGDPLPNSP